MERRRFLMAIASGPACLGLRPAYAEPPAKTPRIGVMWHAANEEEEENYLSALKRGLRSVGYIDGRNIRIINTFADEHYQRYVSQAEELVKEKVDVIVATTMPIPLVAKGATTTIPIVFVLVPDPVGLGLAENLARPGGNLTGTSTNILEISAKRLELFKEGLPSLSRVAVLINPANGVAHRLYAEHTQKAGTGLGVACEVVEVSGGDSKEIEPAFSRISERKMDGVLLLNDGMFYRERINIGRIALKYRLPTMMFSRETVVEYGNLMSYGPHLQLLFERAGTYIDRILNGTKPADLAIEQPSKYQLIVNLKTAKALDLTIPLPFLLRADEVIE